MISSRLIIQPWTLDLAPGFFELSQDEGFTLFPIAKYRQTNLESAQEWIRLNPAKFAVLEKQSGSLIGMGGLTPWKFHDEDLIDITYRLRESAWGKGYGMELAAALVKYGFEEKGLKEITATITPDNHASKKIAAKLGFKFDQNIILLEVPTDLYRLRNSN